MTHNDTVKLWKVKFYISRPSHVDSSTYLEETDFLYCTNTDFASVAERVKHLDVFDILCLGEWKTL